MKSSFQPRQMRLSGQVEESLIQILLAGYHAKLNLLFLLWLATALDPWRGLAYQTLGIVQTSGDDIAFKKPAQIIAAGMVAQFNGASVNGFFQLRRTAEAERDIIASGDFFNGHRYYSVTMMNNSQERKPEIQGQDLGQWITSVNSYPPLETRAPAESQQDELHHKLSISVPPEIKAFVTQRAKQLGLSRSHYIRLLVNADVAKK